MTTTQIDRREVMGKLFPQPEDWAFITGLAGSTFDIANITQDGANQFPLAGVMGAAVPIGLGVALSAPDQKVAVVTGDGELIMGIGSLITVANSGVSNLVIICVDNTMYGETGGQEGHTAGKTSLEGLARGAGIAKAMTIETPDQLNAAFAFLNGGEGPKFLSIRVARTPPTNFRQTIDPLKLRLRFENWFLEGRSC